MHTRFEHSLGVMHTASLLYDSIVRKSAEALKREFAYTTDGLARDRQLVRLAALLHDVGHAPFSHAAEDLFPEVEGSDVKYGHEDYSAAIIRSKLRSAIEDHPLVRPSLSPRYVETKVDSLRRGAARNPASSDSRVSRVMKIAKYSDVILSSAARSLPCKGAAKDAGRRPALQQPSSLYLAMLNNLLIVQRRSA
ncbi:MAG TPA: HD domain-containing protein [Terriglobia bacterium]|nr:HD domain-containing protein [Terriglobia bacterium]